MKKERIVTLLVTLLVLYLLLSWFEVVIRQSFDCYSYFSFNIFNILAEMGW